MSKPPLEIVAVFPIDLARIAETVAYADQPVHWLRFDQPPTDRTRYEIVSVEAQGIRLTAYYSIVIMERDDGTSRKPFRHLTVTIRVPGAPRAICPPPLLAVLAKACGFRLPRGRDYTAPEHFSDPDSGLDANLDSDESDRWAPSLHLIQSAPDLAPPALH